MTLVLTEVSRFGVVMAADTAETSSVPAPSGAYYTRIKFGIQKLFPIKLLRGGVSFWGAAEIFVDAGGRSRLPTDVWLEDFIAKEKFKNLEEFAYTLARTISILHGPEASALGFQVAGMRSDDGRPVFYRITNRDDKDGRRPTFEVEIYDDFPHLAESESVFPDGDRHLFLELHERIRQGGPLMRKDLPIPHPSLSARAEYRAAWVRFISDLYQIAGLSRTIGGKVTTISIGPGDEFDVQTA